ncbi:MAG: sulfatase [Actinomycetota bacterium]|nr:sulfatase [Actinomycetota bacterium]
MSLRRAGAALAFAVALGTPLNAGAQTVPVTERPNVLIIVTDDQRVETMSAMPATRELYRTGGTDFTNAFATTPFCCPSRASIMSGRYPHNHGITSGENGQPNRWQQSASIQRELKLVGYRTGIFGKFLNGWDLQRSPTHFDDWEIYTSSNNYYDGTWNVDGLVQEIPTYSTRFIGQQARNFIEESEAVDDQPWYLYLAPAAPHSPFIAEPRFEEARVGRWDGNPAVAESDRSDKPDFVHARSVDLRKGRYLRKAQLRTLMSVDRMVARVHETMSELGEDNTLAIYLSDNGFMWGEHGLAKKRVPYGPSVRIPMFMRWPEQIGAEVVDDRLAANIDVAPTVFDATDVIPSYTLDGQSLLVPERRTRLLLEFFMTAKRDVPSWASTVTEGFQYIEYYAGPGLIADAEYYDLANDPWQLTNLLGDSDLTNDPDVPALSIQLSADRSCAGQECP